MMIEQHCLNTQCVCREFTVEDILTATVFEHCL